MIGDVFKLLYSGAMADDAWLTVVREPGLLFYPPKGNENESAPCRLQEACCVESWAGGVAVMDIGRSVPL